MRHSIDWMKVLLPAAVLALYGCGGSNEMDEVQPQARALDLRGAVWMEADPGRGSFLVFCHREIGEERVSEVLELNLDGTRRNSWDLTSLDLSFTWPTPAPHWFSASGRLAIVSLSDGEAWILDGSTGRLQKLSSTLTSAAVDPEGGRLYLAEGSTLRVVDVASGETVASRRLPQRLPLELTVGTGGSLNFVLQAPGKETIDWFHVAGPGYAVASQPVRGDGEVRIEAVDDQRGRAFVQHSDPYEADLEVIDLGSENQRRQASRLAGDLFFPRVTGLWKGSPWIWIQNDLGAWPPGVEVDREMWIYDAESLRALRAVPAALDEARDDLRRGPQGQLVVLRDATRVELWDPQSLQVTGRASLPGPADTWACDWQRGLAMFVAFSETPTSVEARLVRVELSPVRVMP